MYLNLIGLGLLGLFVGVLVYYASSPTPQTNHVRSGLLVAQDTGKTKQIVSKTGDASMQIELSRRRAIRSNRTQSIRESTYQRGSGTGALEMLLTSICPTIQMPLLYYDAGGASDEFCYILNDAGNGVPYDAGNARAAECCAQNGPSIYSAGTASDNFCEALDDTGTGLPYDAGNAATRVCSI
mgnify:CR=1 FL=1